MEVRGRGRRRRERRIRGSEFYEGKQKVLPFHGGRGPGNPLLGARRCLLGRSAFAAAVGRHGFVIGR